MILYEKPINEDKLRMAYNNDVIRFYSDSGLEPMYVDVAIDLLTIRLYPGPNGRFFFNFKPYVAALINTRNFEDTLSTDLQTPDADTFIYGFSNGTYAQKEVTITITFDDESTETSVNTLSWLAGVEQLGSDIVMMVDENYVLTPFKRETTNQYYLKYWQGYPFDIAFYRPNSVLYLKNETNLIEQEFNNASPVKRLFISDGRTDESLEDVLPMIEGFNSIRVMQVEEGGEDDKRIALEKIPYKCGVYFKWLNKYGCYNYWLFEDTASLDRSSKSLGELDRDTANLEDTFARSIQIGKESQDNIRVIAELLNADERLILEGIIDSPKIYLFTGQPYARNDYRDWVEVSLKTSSVRIKNPKQPLNNFVLDFELPVRYTQTL